MAAGRCCCAWSASERCTVKPAHLAAIAAIALAGAGVAALGGGWLNGLSLDSALALRHALFGPLARPEASHVAVVAVDEETYRRPPFNETPQAAWPPLLAPVISGVLAGGAKVVGFDIVYSTSLDPLQRGFERDFLLALRNAAREKRLVLGKVQHSEAPILPHRMQQLAVGGNANIRALNVTEDPDGIVRRLPLGFTAADGTPEPGFAAELVMRHTGRPLARGEDGRWRLGDRALATDGAGNLALNFNTGPGDIPAYSLADLYACAQAGKTEYFEKAFGGRTVIFATVLDVEDRRLTTKRFATAAEGQNAPPRCALEPMALYRADRARDSIPGVFIHATALNNLLDGTELREWPARIGFAAAAGFAAIQGFIGFLLPIGAALAAGLALLALLPPAAALLLQAGIATPWLDAAAAGLFALGAVIALRFAVTDKDKRLMAKVFSLYLPPTEINRMLASGRMPALGGEEREVTVLFSDIAGFTAISEACEPTVLVPALNEYFSAMTAIIEDHGGFVDKFIGDAIVAVFSAPLHDARHAEHAVRAALHMRDLLAEQPERFAAAGIPFRTRIGINTGPALIGNIGSPRRFNYTAIGDAVNLASRLEGANKKYGTAILMSEATAKACGNHVLMRAIDTVRVVGRDQPVRLFEPLARSGRATPAQDAAASAFAAAWAALERRNPAAALAALGPLDQDAAARILADHIRALGPPSGADWPPVTNLTEK